MIPLSNYTTLQHAYPSVQGEELSDDFDPKNIPTLIRFFAPAGQVDQFKPNGFVYPTGSFNINNQDGFPNC